MLKKLQRFLGSLLLSTVAFAQTNNPIPGTTGTSAANQQGVNVVGPLPSGLNIIGGVFEGGAPWQIQIQDALSGKLATVNPDGSQLFSGKVGGQAATNQAPIGNPVFTAGQGTGGIFPIIQCDKTKFLSITTATTTLIANAVFGQNIYVCSLAISGTPAAVDTVFIEDGTQTSTACDSGTPVQLTPTFNLPASALTITWGSGLGSLFRTTATNRQICAVSSSANTFTISVNFAQF